MYRSHHIYSKERSATSIPSASRNLKPKRIGSRSVTTLTPTQLARKRTNDREAQRAIRTRTKQCIQQMEDEKQALRDSLFVSSRTTQDLLHRNASLEAELDDLRAALCLSSDMSLMSRTHSTSVFESFEAFTYEFMPQSGPATHLS